MSLENPYRAAGAFSGKAYIRRDADAQLLEQLDDNQYYPYFAAPRQSGKSSLLLRTMAALDPTKYRSALVDLSPFVVTSYDDFWRQFLHEVARSANFDPAPIGREDPREVFLQWLSSCKQRLVVFMDEIDVLLSVDVREQIFSKFRTFFNLRARLDTAALQRLQFVFAGAAHSSRFIKDPRWSPFNVAIEIELEDLSPTQVSQLAAYLGTAGSFAGPDLTARVSELSGGSVFLCQLIFEQLWNQAARGKSRLDAADVDAVVTTIVAESPRNIHFYNIFRLVTADARLTMLFRRLTEGQELGHEEAKELRLTGICRGANPFRNEIYARVFGPGGPLDLKVGDKQIQLTRALDGAIARRDHLQGDPRAEPRAIAAAEAEIRRLRKEFREGSQLQAGDVLGRGRYLLEARIGQGGFAAVWRAVDQRDQSRVALKVLHGQFAEDKSRRERFFRGAWKMSELQHPAIVRVLEPYGDENGQYYFVMEYLAGGTLHEAVQDEQLAPEVALRILAQVGEALQFAHERGLVHRDVKPSNVMIDGERGKLTDFDLVRETDITGGTRTGAMGTFLYAAPEVMSRPQDADVRADVYGLGMTVVFALFGGDLAMDVIRDADRFIDRLPCNGVLHDVLKKAVAWDRNDRFASAADFVSALRRASEPEAEAEAQERVAAVARPAAPAAMPAAAAAVSRGATGAAKATPSREAPAPPAPVVPRWRGGPEQERRSQTSQATPGLEVELAEEERGVEDGAVGQVQAAAKRHAPTLASMPLPVSEDRSAQATPRASRAIDAADSQYLAQKEHVPRDRSLNAPAPATVQPSAAPAGGPAPVTVMPAPEQRAGRWPLVLAVTGLAATLLLAFVIPGLLAGEQTAARVRLTERAPTPTPTAIFEPDLVDPVRTGTAAGEEGTTVRADPVRGTTEVVPATELAGASEPADATTTGIDPDATAEHPGTSSQVAPLTPDKHSDTQGPAVRAPSLSEQIDEGCRLVRVGDAKVGVKILLEAHERKPRDQRLMLCLADGSAKVGNYKGAANFYNRLLADNQRNWKALLGAGQAYEALNERTTASIYYTLLLKQEPGNPSALAFFAEQAALAANPKRPGGG